MTATNKVAPYASMSGSDGRPKASHHHGHDWDGGYVISYLRDKPGTVTFGTIPKTGEMTPLIVYRCRLQSQFRAGGKAGSGQ
jgi:hypothetical protein